MMRGYGLPRNDNVKHPDLADIKLYGLKTGRLHPKWNHACNCKNTARRYWKKKERRAAKRDIKENWQGVMHAQEQKE